MIKELRQDRYRIEMIVPTMIVGNQNRILITVRDEHIGQYISEAAVNIYVKYVPDELFVPANSNMEFDYEYRAVEIETGNYEVTFIPDEVGNLSLRAEIRLEEQGNEPIIIDTIQTVLPSEVARDNHNNFTPWAILGGIGMGVMMFFMLGWDMH